MSRACEEAAASAIAIAATAKVVDFMRMTPWMRIENRWPVRLWTAADLGSPIIAEIGVPGPESGRLADRRFDRPRRVADDRRRDRELHRLAHHRAVTRVAQYFDTLSVVQ